MKRLALISCLLLPPAALAGEPTGSLPHHLHHPPADDWSSRAALEAAAEAGDVRAELALAARLEAQEQPDAEGAFQWYQRAARQGSAEGAFNLAQCLRFGHGTAMNVAAAVPWYETAAAAGFPPAQVELAILLIEGIDIEQDYERASELVFTAAAAGNRKALMLRKNLYDK